MYLDHLDDYHERKERVSWIIVNHRSPSSGTNPIFAPMKCSYFILLLFLATIMASCDKAGRQITVMTYNIKNDYQKDGPNNWSSRKDRMMELFRQYQPDLFGVQEALSNQVLYIDSSLTSHAYVGVGRDDGKSKGEYCAIFYNKNRFRVIQDSTIWLSQTPSTVSVGWDAALERICTFALFEDLGSHDKIWVLNSHYDHIGATARTESSKVILKLIEEIGEDRFPLILVGDLNALADEEPIQVLSNRLSDAFHHADKTHRGPLGTWNGFEDEVIDRRIDYIFIDGIKVLSYAHIDDRLDNNKHISDHLPVMATLQFDWDL